MNSIISSRSGVVDKTNIILRKEGKNMRKVVVFCLSFLMALSVFIVPVQAIDKQDDYLKVNYVVEKTSETNVTIKIDVKNISDHAVKNIDLKNSIPSEFEVEGNKNITIDSLNSSESKEVSIKVTLKDNISIKGDDKTKGDGGNQKKENKQNSATKTGDSTKIGWWIISLVISIFVIIGVVKSKKARALLSLFIVATMIVGNIGTVKAANNIQKDMQLKENVVFNNKNYEFGLDISYEIENDGEIGDQDTISRGEWINRLVAAMHYEKIEDTLDQPYFSDTTGTIVEDSINYAVAYRIVDLDNQEFHPQTIASREFIAVTTVKALGFQPVEDLSCADAGDITDLKNAYLAVDLGIINLIDNHFYPTGNGTRGLANQALKVVEDVLSSTKVSDTPQSDITYADGVIVLNEEEAVIDGTTLTVDADGKTKGVKVGDIIAVKDYACYKVTAVQQNGNKIVLSTTEPKIEEAIKSMNMQGKLHADVSQFEPAEGVRMSAPEGRSISTPNYGKFPFEVEIPGSDHIKIKGSLDLKITADAIVDFQLGMRKPICKNVMFTLNPNANLEAGIYVGDSEGAIDQQTLDKVKRAFANGYKCKGSINLGKIPLVGIPGCRVYADVGMAYDINGHLKIILTFDGQLGAQIYNDHLRLIHSAKPTFTPQLGGELKTGPEIAAVLKTINFDLFDISASVGAAGQGEIIYRNPSMICSDLTIYVYLNVSVLKNSVLNKFIKVDAGWGKDFWDSDNSPVKANYHQENWKKVPKCTYKDATINGVVIDADTLKPIQGAEIKAINSSDNKIEESVISNDSGGFTLEIRAGVTYCIESSKTGYITCKEENVVLEEGEIKQLQPRMQIKGNGETNVKGKAGGIIKDAMTGEGIGDVNIKARVNWGNKIGHVVGEYTTNDSGEYRIENLPVGYYTLELSKDNYSTEYLDIVVTEDGNYQQHGTLNPVSIENDNSELRVVLTWGENPSDVDLHTIGLSPTNQKFHVFYNDKKYYENGELICDLDVDDTTSYGPETITLYKVNPNEKYSFYLHDYSNKSDENSMMLSNSGAKLTIYVKGKYKQTIHIPANKVGTQWHAFDFDSGSGTIKLVDEFSNTNDADSVGK